MIALTTGSPPNASAPQGDAAIWRMPRVHKDKTTHMLCEALLKGDLEQDRPTPQVSTSLEDRRERLAPRHQEGKNIFCFGFDHSSISALTLPCSHRHDSPC